MEACLSEVIARIQGGPQTITRNGKPSVIVVSADEWSRKVARKGSLAEFLLGSPLRRRRARYRAASRRAARPRPLSFLIGANVLSEARRPEPNRQVLEWLDRLDEDRAFLSVVSLAEIRCGVALMDAGRRRDALAEWLARDLPERFAGRFLAIDETPPSLGHLGGRAARIGLASMDGPLAAVALTRELTLVTRNVRDFENLGVKLFDPWAPASPGARASPICR